MKCIVPVSHDSGGPEQCQPDISEEAHDKVRYNVMRSLAIDYVSFRY